MGGRLVHEINAALPICDACGSLCSHGWQSRQDVRLTLVAGAAAQLDPSPDGIDTLDVAYVMDGSRDLRIASIVPANYPGLMAMAGDYRFTVQLASLNAGSRTVRLTVHWDFEALTFPANPVETIEGAQTK